MEEPDSLRHKQAILDYWTLVEFFTPYILENTLNHKQNCQTIYVDELSSKPLPWLNAQTIEENDPTTPFAKGYYLYLGLFSIEETADRARHTFAKQPSQWQSVNWQSCLAAGTTTCFARLTLTTHGIPLFGTLTLSTLPWAHGRLLNKKEESITIEQYWKSVNRLFLSLRNELTADLPIKLMKKPKLQAGYLDAEALSKLTEILYTWAGYKPKGYPVALIESLSVDNTVAAKEPQIKTERDVPILNSFYIQDLESAAISLNTQKGKPIDHYLSDKDDNRILLESEEGKKTILNTLRPEKIPSGRWPDPLSHQQSLMQQFAINATFDSLEMKSVFSVNGPPGTGKTSLLREIIAENIVARAEALSQFETAKSAFIGRQALNFENNAPIFISELHPSLLGYEMLVVSSNNTAVQNLSKELPLRSQLDPSFHYASYLETVATKALGLNLGTAIQDDKVMQDFDLTSFARGGDHSQKVKAPPLANDFGSKDCVNLSSSIAVSRLNLGTAIQDDKVMQDFDLTSFARGGDHSQKVKAPPLANDFGSKDCVNLSSSIAVSRLKEKGAWGLISATLGNMENCRNFVERVFITRNETKGEARIWEWIDAYNGPSFIEARDVFIKIKNRQEHLSTELEILAFLHDEIDGHTMETYCAKAFENLKDAEEVSEGINSRLSHLIQEELETKEHLKILQEREMLWKRERPSLLNRLFNRMLDRKASQAWSEKFSAFGKERIQVIEELHTCRAHLKELRTIQIGQNHTESDKGELLLDQALLFHIYQEAYRELKQTHPRVPGSRCLKRRPMEANVEEMTGTRRKALCQASLVSLAVVGLFP